MGKYGVVGKGGVAGGRGFGDRRKPLAVLQELSGRFAHGPSRATRARWPDLQATATAADPFDLRVAWFGVLHCVWLLCVLFVVICRLTLICALH